MLPASLLLQLTDSLVAMLHNLHTRVRGLLSLPGSVPTSTLTMKKGLASDSEKVFVFTTHVLID